LGYEEGSSSGQPRNKESIKFFKSTTMTTTNLQKQSKPISCPGGVKKKVPGLNL